MVLWTKGQILIFASVQERAFWGSYQLMNNFK
jgi:hypothetical protein